MNIALATRKALIATVVVPVIALTAISVESFAGLSGAEAQQAAGRGGGNNGGGTSGGGSNGGGSRGDEGRGEKPYLLMQGNCVQTPGTAPVNCPPPVQMSEAQDCSCEIKYRMVGGQRVAIKDCYFEVGETIRYCRSDAIRLR